MQQVACISHQFLQRRPKKKKIVLIYILAGRKRTISEELDVSVSTIITKLNGV